MKNMYEERCKLIKIYIENKKFERVFELREETFTKFYVSQICEEVDIVVHDTGRIRIKGEKSPLYEEFVKLKESIEDGTCFPYWIAACDEIRKKYPNKAYETVFFIEQAINCHINGNNYAAMFTISAAIEQAIHEYLKSKDISLEQFLLKQPEEMTDEENLIQEIFPYYKSPKKEPWEFLNILEVKPTGIEFGIIIENITKLFEIMN